MIIDWMEAGDFIAEFFTTIFARVWELTAEYSPIVVPGYGPLTYRQICTGAFVVSLSTWIMFILTHIGGEEAKNLVTRDRRYYSKVLRKQWGKDK